ncbi:hypothetical protein [Providencia rettgeri]|uniref:hypothetical protein n=1 Tax=Providencia rettgeri TaxID=587 RepID=UPI0030183287
MPELTYPHQAAVVFLEVLHNQENFLMLKSTLIAKCLFQCGMIADVKSGEYAVKNIFNEHFPDHSFDEWNTNLSSSVVNKYLTEGKGANIIRINVLIENLWDF